MGVRVAQRKPNDSCAHEKCDGYDHMTFYMDNFDMNPEEIKSMRIALVVYNADDESDVHVYLGRVQQANGEWYFTNEERGWKISLNSEQLNHLKHGRIELYGNKLIFILNAFLIKMHSNLNIDSSFKYGTA